MLKDIEEYPHVYEKWVKAIMKLRKDALFNGLFPQENVPPQRTVGGKFFDSTDGKCSTVSAHDYDEQIEREVAENIIDWWSSKKSYKEWYAHKFLQLKINFDEEE